MATATDGITIVFVWKEYKLGEWKMFLTFDIKGFLCDILDTSDEHFDIFDIK